MIAKRINTTGNIVGLNDTLEDNLDIKLEGNTTQETTTGKNLLKPYAITSGTLNGITYSYDAATQTYTFNGTCNRDNTTIRVGDNEVTITTNTYLSVHYVGGSVTNYARFQFGNSGWSKISYVDFTNISSSSPIKSAKSQASEDFVGVNGRNVRFNNGSVATNLKVKFMVANSTDTTYEPYTNGASPNPDYPQNVNVVTGRNEIDIVGKNLFDSSFITTQTGNGISLTINNGLITITGTATASTNIYYNMTNEFFNLENGETYTLSAIGTTTGLRNFGFKRGSGADLFVVKDNDTNFTKTTTINDEILTYNRFDFYIPNGRTVNASFYIQLEKGNSATTFELYKKQSYEINLGKNLFDKDNANVINAYISGSAKITSSSGDKTIYISCTPNTTYTIQKMVPRTTSKNRFRVGTSETIPVVNMTLNQYYNGGDDSTVTQYTITTNSIANYLVFFCYTTDTETTFDEIEASIQIEKGNQATSYSPYFTPIELCKIGDYKDSIYYQSHSKNLFNKDTASSGHYINNKGGLGNSNNYSASDYIVVNGTQKVTTSGNTDIRADYASKVAFYTSDKTFISYGDIAIGSNTYTIPSNAYYMRITCRNTDLNYTQVEEGETATEYQPYGSGWFIKKNIGKVVLNGSETWNTGQYGTNSYSHKIADMKTSVNNITNPIYVMTNLFKGVSYNNRTSSGNNIVYADVELNINLYIRNTSYTSVSDFTTMLSSNNLIVYYVLNTPTYTKITNTTLVNQLEELKNANSYNKQTTIGQSNANAFFNLSINYPQRPTNFIEECKNGAYCNRYGKIEFNGLTINEANQLVDFSIESGCYDNGDIIGNTYVKKIDSNLLDSLNDNLIDEDFEAYVGAKYLVEDVETTEYLDLGKYTVENPTDTQTENRTSFVGYDKLLDNLENTYSTELDYENDTITIRDVYLELCDNLGLIPVNTIFTNSDITVEGNPFTNGEKNRDVLKAIEKVSCSFVDIDPNTNKIKLKWLSNNLDYTFEKSDYSTLEGGKVEYGPINTLIIRSSEVESENVSISDTESILTYGEHPFTIVDDYFLYNSDKRQAALNAIWEKVHGLKYVDCKLTSLTGKPFLTVGDKIRVITGENEYFDTYILKHKFTYNGAFMSEIESPVLTQQETKTKQDISLGEKLRNTQIIVNKQNGEIQAIASKTETIDTTVGNNYIELNSKFDNYTPTSRTVEIENRVTNLQTDTYTKTQIDTKLTDGSVTKVMTTSGTFDIDGMHYEKTNAPTSTTINEVGVGVKKTSDTDYVLFAGYVDDNNTQYTAFKGQTIVASENMLVENYFVVGSKSRMEDYEDGTGVFYIGG